MRAFLYWYLWAALASASAGPMDSGADFKKRQMTFPRVRAAAAAKEPGLRALFAERGLPFPPKRLFLRAFKREGLIEAWAGKDGEGPLEKVKEYPICAASGQLGPKRREGDGQVPEGFYSIETFNPQSQFHLSLRVSYPNASDRARGGPRLGGDIYIHGNCVTIGCMPVTDEGIAELYWLAVSARGAGQKEIPVHIFPARLDAAGLKRLAAESPRLSAFWEELAPAYARFEETRLVPRVRVGPGGAYRLDRGG